MKWRWYLVDPEEDVRGVGVVADHPGLHLPLVVRHEDDLSGGESDGADRLKALTDNVRFGELDDPPFFGEKGGKDTVTTTHISIHI